MTDIAPRPFGGLVRECEKRDIGKTVAFRLVKSGVLETFKIGTRRFVYLDSLDSLPQRLVEVDKAVRA